MKTDWREFQAPSSGKTAPKVWRIRQDGDRYYTEHGLLGGAMQTFTDVPGEKGKPDTKAYVDAVANCSFHLEREVRKKVEHGYVEYVDGKPVKETVDSLDFNKLLPKNFTSYKPKTKIEPAALQKLFKAGKARFTRKYNGMQHVCCHHAHGWEIYTRRMDLTTERFPNHVKALESLTQFGVGTIIVGEAVCYDRSNSNVENFRDISRFTRSDPEKARKLVEDDEVSEPAFIVFDVLFHNEKDLSETSYGERSKLWADLPNAAERNSLIASVDYFDVTPETWEDFCKSNGWEGFVVTDTSCTPGKYFYSFNGDAKRPAGHHKLKPYWEEDVVVFAATEGSGKRLGGIGAVFVKQKYPAEHPKAGEWFFCGKVGSGFTDESLNEIEGLFKKNNLPILKREKDVEKLDLSDLTNNLVAELKYGERQPGTNKFQFPVIRRIRDDKAPEECEAQRLSDAQEDDADEEV